MTEHYDGLETRDPAERERSVFGLLPDIISQTVAAAPGWAQHLNGVDPRAVSSRAALAALPILRKSDLMELQSPNDPLGGLATRLAGHLPRLFSSPGPIFEPQPNGTDCWRAARALFAAGFRKGDIVHNTFSYHMTPGGWILDDGARALGCALIPAGPGNTEQQLQLIQHYRPSAFVGVPDFLKILLDKAQEAGAPITSFKRAMVSGGPLFPSLRDEYTSRGIAVSQCYATAELGTVAYESPEQSGMIVDEGAIVEIVRPGTGNPVPNGEVGEIVVTTLNRDYPMIRLAAGDLSAVLDEPSPCGRTNMRIKGWMGRADQTTKVKGMFVRPEQMAEIAKRIPQIARLRLSVSRVGEQDAMTLSVEPNPGVALETETIAGTLQDVTKLKGSVVIAQPGSLPNDGKVISDDREL